MDGLVLGGSVLKGGLRSAVARCGDMVRKVGAAPAVVEGCVREWLARHRKDPNDRDPQA